MEEAVKIDVIILSYAQNDELKHITLNCIQSLTASEDPAKIKFNIIIFESEKFIKPYQYPVGQTIYSDEPFGYNRYMNMGIRMSNSPYVCLCNNDLIFHPLWATEILKSFSQFYDLASASPFCSILHPTLGYKVTDGIKLGYGVRDEIAGWCLFFKREILEFTGELDENYNFWCADNDYANTLGTLKLNHCLICSSVVDHLDHKTLNNQTKDRQDELTEKECLYFYKKWRPRLGEYWKEV